MQHDRLDFIDTLRAVAAVAVMAYHLPLVADGGPLVSPGWLDRALLVFGASGVDLFFCISGFVLCLMVPHYSGSRHPVIAFYVKRLLRIAPLFFVVLAAWVVMFWATHRPVDWWQIAAEVTFLFNLFPKTAGGFAFADWTIGVEMLLYAAFPVLIRLVPGPRRKLVALLLAFPAFELVMLGYQALPIESELLERIRWLSVFHHAPSFLLGMLVYDLHRLPAAAKHARVLASAAVVTAVLAFIDAFGDRPLLGWYSETLGWGLVLFAASLQPHLLAGRVSALVGRMSYSMYLWHGPVIMAMGGAFLGIFGLGLPEPASLALCLAVALAVILPVSWISYRLIETPGNRLATRLVRRLDRPGAAEGPPARAAI